MAVISYGVLGLAKRLSQINVLAAFDDSPEPARDLCATGTDTRGKRGRGCILADRNLGLSATHGGTNAAFPSVVTGNGRVGNGARLLPSAVRGQLLAFGVEKSYAIIS